MTSSQLLAQSQKLKEEGNKLFSKRMYKEAWEMYSKAYEKCPSVAAYLTNRALCSVKLQQWHSAVDDCKRALELDPHSVKAYFYMGQAMCEQAHYDEAIVHLKRASELAKELNENYGDEIAKSVRIAKRKRWNHMEDKRVRQEIELQTYLSQLMLHDKEKKISSVINYMKVNSSSDEVAAKSESTDVTNKEEKKEPPAIATTTTTTLPPATTTTTTIIKEKESLTEKQQQEIEAIESEYARRLGELNRLFADNDQRRRKRDIPDYLCGKISFELMLDPVITPSGITYDRYDIEQHLQRVGRFDPITRQELNIDQLIPNLSMKEVIENFINENEWIDGAY